MSETGSSGSEEAGSSLRPIESRKDFDSLVRSSKPTVVVSCHGMDIQSNLLAGQQRQSLFARPSAVP